MKEITHDKGWYNVICPICKKAFHLKPSKLKKDKNHYCSRACHKEAKKEYMAGEKNHQYGLRGEKNASWKGGEKITCYGYKTIYCPDHPFAPKDGHIFEHRLVAEKYLLTEENSVEVNGKRYLRPDYDVHHKDFDRLNNDPENLQVMTKREHRRLHSELNKRPRDSKTGQFQKGKLIFKKTKESSIVPTRATDGSVGYDMYAEIEQERIVKPHRCEMIGSGIAMAIPKGYGGLVFARSGLSTKEGLRPATCVSVIDSDYRGEVGLPMYNDSDEERVIYPHERIAQIVFVPVITPEIEVVDSLDEFYSDRGSNGFGSTGK